jgi:hypothetical protein
MSLEIIKQLNIDFCDAKCISINAKQYDRFSRFILVSCYNNGISFPLESTYNSAFIRYKKSDGLGVFNNCEITNEGKIFIELSEQMLAVAGRSYADLVIFYNDPESSVNIDNETGELIIGNGCKILSTMQFSINVIGAAFDNTEIESSYEYNALNDLIIKATADYTTVINACKTSEENSKESENNAKLSEENAKKSEENAKESENNAKLSEENAKKSEENAKESENIVLIKTQEVSEMTAEVSNNVQIVEGKVNEATNYALLSQSYAVGGTDTRDNEDVDNSKYYYSKTKNISDTLGGLFLPKGTIEFSQLEYVDKGIGYVYHIKDDFVTDSTFKDGGGIAYPAGTNVYCTADGYWDCFVGGNLTVIDDDNGNVEFVYVNLYNTQNIAELQSRIKALEEQTVLSITE